MFRRLRNRPVSACLCTLAIHAPYRRRARLLCAASPTVPWVVLTDEPDDFADLPIREEKMLNSLYRQPRAKRRKKPKTIARFGLAPFPGCVLGPILFAGAKSPAIYGFVL